MLVFFSGCKNELKYKLEPLPTPPMLPYEIKGYVSTIAGNYPWAFNATMDVVGDTAGNLYVIDQNNQVIRKFSITGEISILAGTLWSAGAADGVGESASFNYPSAMVMDADQNIIVADTGNHLIRKVTLTGVVTTIAGSGSGFLDGNGTNAKFNTPASVAVDSANNIFVADFLNNAIRKITPNGDVTTFAGGTQGYQNGVGTAARFYKPSDVAFDSLGNLFVADSWNWSIRKITPGAVVSFFAGGNSYGHLDGNGVNAQFKFPYSLAIDSQNNIFVADPDDYTIRKITPAQDVTTFAGGLQGSVDGTGTSARFNAPTGLFIDKQDTLYLADSGSSNIRKITSLAVVTTLYDNSTRNKDGNGRFAQFDRPTSIVQDSLGNFFIADSGNKRIRKMSADGNVTTFAGSTTGNTDATGIAAQFNTISAIAIDSADNIYVSDYGNYSIRKITPQGVVTTLAGGTSGNTDGQGTAARFAKPWGIVIDKTNNLYVTDSDNHNIRKITPSGQVTTIAGGVQGYADGNGLSAQFYIPRDIVIDSKNNLYVADSINNSIRKISTNGDVTTFAGSTTAGSTDGIGSSAAFFVPYSLCIDSKDSLYVGDLLNFSVRKITSSGKVSTIAGAGVNAYKDGYKESASFSAIGGMVIAKDGYLYVTDITNSVIRKIE